MRIWGIDLGGLDTAQRYVQDTLKWAISENERRVDGISRVLVGRILSKIDRSRTEEAKESIVQGIKLLAKIKSKPYITQGHLYLGELYADTGKKENALVALRQAKADFTEMGMDYWVRRTQGALKTVED